MKAAQRARNTVRFDPMKLANFAAYWKRDVKDIVDQLAQLILQGRAPDPVLALVAGQYDDHIAHVVENPTSYEQPIIFSNNHGAAVQHHVMEAALGSVFIATPGASIISRRAHTAYLCVGYEYLNLREIEDHLRNDAELKLCDHILKEAQEMPTVTAARIWWDEATGSYALVTPYDEELVRWMKLIAREDKKFDFEQKIWYISPRIVDETKAKVAKIFGSCHFAGRSTTPIAAAPLPSDTFSQFAQLVGIDSLRKAYFDAAKRLHGDAGGTGNKMTELNVLWKTIEEALK